MPVCVCMRVCLHACVCQLMAEQQDDQLELVSGTIGVLKNMSERIGMELDEQTVYVHSHINNNQ